MSIRKYGASSFKRPMTEEKEMSEVKTFDVDGTEFEVWENTSGNGEYVLYEDCAALKAERDALATENLALKHQTPDVRSISMWEAIDKAEKLMDDGMPELAMVEAFEILKMKRIPATDAYANKLRAEGVEMFAKHCDDNVSFVEPEDEELYTLMQEAATAFAANLRKENGND